MVDVITTSPQHSADDEVLNAQFLRAATSFEAIIKSQIEVKNKLGDRLNNAIRAGIIILGLIAVSILILLLTLSSQVSNISSVVIDMNQDFSTVSTQMDEINSYMRSMEKRVVLLEEIDNQTQVMDQEIDAITQEIGSMRTKMTGIKNHVRSVRGNITDIAVAIDQMNLNVQNMSVDMHRMGKSARSMNKMFPFP